MSSSKFSTSDNCEISYTIHGTKGPRLALVHTLALDRSVWDGVVAALAGKAQILTYDCRGHGRSGHPHSPYTVELFARDLAELLDHVGWDNTAVAGASMGGCVTLAFGGMYGKRVDALGLIDTTAWYGPDAPKQFRERAAAAKAKGMAGLIDFQLSRWFSEGWRKSHEARVKGAMDVFLANDFACYESSCGLLGDADLRHYMEGFKMPVAVVVGEEDYATPVAMAKALHEGIPHSTLRIIDGARHLTPIECPDVIAAEISALLNRIR